MTRLSSPAIRAFPIRCFGRWLFTALGVFLYIRHSFGVRVHCVGDNPESAAEMGIDVDRTRILVFVFTGIGAALAGIFSVMINFVWWPTTAMACFCRYWLAYLSAGPPNLGWHRHRLSAAPSARRIVAFIETGVIAAV